MDSTTIFILYECGICECLHPWDWIGDCRDDNHRFPSTEFYASKFNRDEDHIEVRSWDERLAADA